MKIHALALSVFLLAVTGGVYAQDGPSAAPATQASESAPETDPVRLLLNELNRLERELLAMREQLAKAQLEAQQANRELAELRQFIADDQNFAQDFAQYQAVKEVAERESRQRLAEESRQRNEQARTDRKARLQAARAQRDAERAENKRESAYREAGFSPIGNDVYVGEGAFYYQSHQNVPYRFDYELGLGHYLRFYPPTYELDYSSMTISGSVLNASEVIRNVGIAITFFDEYGNQVGGETVQINNARPNVPYPFTAEVSMALNRPFRSSTSYVLYADPVAEAAADTAPTTPGSGGGG